MKMAIGHIQITRNSMLINYEYCTLFSPLKKIPRIFQRGVWICRTSEMYDLAGN